MTTCPRSPLWIVLPLLAAPLHPPPAAAQSAEEAAALARIREEGLERSRVLETFSTLTDVFGPRLTNTPAFHAAARWARERLASWGLEARLEPFEFGRGWTLEGLVLEMAEPRYAPLRGYPEAWSPPTAGVLEGEPVYVGGLDAERIREMAGRLRGAIVLAHPPQPGFIHEDRPQPTEHEGAVPIGAPRFIRPEGAVPRGELQDLMDEVGAGVVLEPDQGAHGTLFVLGRREMIDPAVDPAAHAPSVVLSGEHYNLLVRMVERGLPVRLRVGVDVRYHEEGTEAVNVLAEIPGTDPAVAHEVVMAGAHLDSWHAAVGATDNADGVAALMEAARLLVAADARPRRTVRIALWGGEEQGLLGSRAWVARHLEGPGGEAARRDLQVYFNQDIGGGATYGLYLQGSEAARPVLDAWIAGLRDVGARRNVDAAIGSSDHVPFGRAGVPAFSTVQDYRDYDVRTHHTSADDFERLREEDLKQSAVVLATLLYRAAMMEGGFPREEAR